MTIELKEGRHYVSVVFVYPPSDEFLKNNPNVGRKADLMGILWHDDEEIQFQYRFRYYMSDDKMDGDEKSWYTVSTKLEGRSLEEEIAKIAKVTEIVCTMTSLRFGSKYDILPIDGDHQKAIQVLQSAPWANFQLIPQGVTKDMLFEADPRMN